MPTGGGGGAPASSDFMIISATDDPNLSNERRLTAGTGIGLIDNGPNSTLVIENTLPGGTHGVDQNATLPLNLDTTSNTGWSSESATDDAVLKVLGNIRARIKPAGYPQFSFDTGANFDITGSTGHVFVTITNTASNKSAALALNQIRARTPFRIDYGDKNEPQGQLTFFQHRSAASGLVMGRGRALTDINGGVYAGSTAGNIESISGTTIDIYRFFNNTLATAGKDESGSLIKLRRTVIGATGAGENGNFLACHLGTADTRSLTIDKAGDIEKADDSTFEIRGSVTTGSDVFRLKHNDSSPAVNASLLSLGYDNGAGGFTQAYAFFSKGSFLSNSPQMHWPLGGGITGITNIHFSGTSSAIQQGLLDGGTWKIVGNTSHTGSVTVGTDVHIDKQTLGTGTGNDSRYIRIGAGALTRQTFGDATYTTDGDVHISRILDADSKNTGGTILKIVKDITNPATDTTIYLKVRDEQAAVDYFTIGDSGETIINGDLEHTGTKCGLYSVAAVVQAAAIASPAGGATVDAESRTAIDLIRTALTGIGITL